MAWRYRLYPTPADEEALVRHCGHARFVWNLALEQANQWRVGRHPVPGSAERFRQLAEARRAFAWLGEGSSSVQQQALRDFDQALRKWWAGTHRRPRWRKQGVDEGFCVRDVTVRRLSHKWAVIMVPKCGAVRFRLTRPLGDHGMARITKDRAGRWHVAFAAPQPSLLRTPTGAVVGVDLGVVNTVTTSDGDCLHIPGWRPSEERRLVRLQRKLARQQKGSKRRARTKHAVAVLHARAGDRRKDWAEKASTAMVTRYDLVVFEDLRVKTMLRSGRGTLDHPGRNVRPKAALNRRIAASAWSTLVRRTRQKAEAAGAEVVLVDPRHSSQTCSACGDVAAANRPSQAVFCCQACGHGEHADINAAKNIRARGLRVPARGGRPEVGVPGEARTTRREAA